MTPIRALPVIAATLPLTAILARGPASSVPHVPPAADARAPAAVQGTPDLATRIDAYVRPFVKARLFNGIILVARSDSVLVHRAYGTADYALGTPMRRGVRFKIGSITKDVTAAAILALERDGRLSREDAAVRYLPALADHPTITIRHLLEHTHGLPDWRSVPGADVRALTGAPLDDTVRWLASQPALFPAGSRRSYGSSSYLILAHLIETITGRDYFASVSRAVLGPMGMERTTPLVAEQVIEGLVPGYENSSGPSRIRYPAPRHPSLGVGTSYLVSTATDLLRWSREAAEALDWPVTTERGRRVRWTSGMSGGYVARVHRYPDDDLTVVLLSNVFNAAFRPLMPAIAALALGDDPGVPPDASPAHLSPEARRRLTGEFACADGAFGRIGVVETAEGLGFTVDAAPGEVFAAWPVSPDAVFVPTDFARVEIATGPDGRREATYDGGFTSRCVESE